MEAISIFKDILDSNMKKESQETAPVIGWTCTYLPLEILDAAGIKYCRIFPSASYEKADGYLDPNFCPLIKISMGAAMSGAYSFLSGILVLNTCDGMRRLYDTWRFYLSPPFSFLLDVPRNISTSSVDFFKGNLLALKESIEEHFGVKITNAKLTEAIKEANITRSLLSDLFYLQGKGKIPLKHGDIIDIIEEGWKIPRKVFNVSLNLFLDRLNTNASVPSSGASLLLTGSMLDGSPLVRLLESFGARVVSSDICNGGRFIKEIPLYSDPLYSLSKAYLEKIPCARMYDTEARISYIKNEINRTGARGVIYYSLKFCDPYLYEAPIVREFLEKTGIPVLFIEGEYTGKVDGRCRTRTQAFIEMLERK